ncbi:MAG: PQQ-binding-like beta-propeller repeat protein [Verrucomicrobiales bacterium]|nr:PQQ-binding-like beta-propeller repeat protein [Verrucomicrobiales bacterium]
MLIRRVGWSGFLLWVLCEGVVPCRAGVAADDWPCWRGPTKDGVVRSTQALPLTWSETENVRWKVAVPGRGHGSPSVAGSRIYLATAEAESSSQRVLCYERESGRLKWNTVVHQGPFTPGGHRHASLASGTVAVDGDRLFISFLHAGGIHTSALDLEGKVLWQTKICDFVLHQGFGASPVVHGPVVLVTADHRGGGTVAALDRMDGKVRWTASRPRIANYTSPSVMTVGGREQMVLAGCNLVSSFDPLTGSKLWEIDSSTEECVVTAVTDGTRVFVSGGYPRNHTMAVLADGSGKVAWQNTTRAYVPSMIVDRGHLYAVLDAGMAVCWKADTGEELWKERLGGEFYASPVRVGDRMYAVSLAAVTSVFEARPGGFQLLAQNKLGDEAFASPAIAGGRIFLRVAATGDRRQESLYCLGLPEAAGP